jgi:hypothetical protein
MTYATVVVWLLFTAAGSHGLNQATSPFKTQESCRRVANDLMRQAKDMTGSPYAYGFCVQAEVIMKVEVKP